MVVLLGCPFYYRGSASDTHIVRDSGFLDMLEPLDQVMADGGFKINTDLATKQCQLWIPPSAAKGTQKLAKDVKDVKRTNLQIYVEQTISRMKLF